MERPRESALALFENMEIGLGAGAHHLPVALQAFKRSPSEVEAYCDARRSPRSEEVVERPGDVLQSRLL